MFLTTSPRWWRILHAVILNPVRCIIMRNLQCLATSQSAAMPPYFSRTKALSCQKAPIWSKKERGFIVLTPSTSPPRPHLPVVLAWQREGDFYFGFSAGGQSSLGCGIRGDVAMFPLPRLFFFNPSQQSLWDSEQHISSSMRNGSELRAARRSHGVQRSV